MAVEKGVEASELGESDRRRIRLEETYRSEVRQQLAAPRGRGSGRIVTFLNTSLGLWLLSTVVVSIVGTAYALAKERWDEGRQVQKELRQQARTRNAAIRMLDAEISFRISNVLSYLNERAFEQAQAASAGLRPKEVTPTELAQFLRLSPHQATSSSYPILSLHHGNERRILLGLLAELARLQAEKEEVDPQGALADSRAAANGRYSDVEPGFAREEVERVIARVADMRTLFGVKREKAGGSNAETMAGILNGATLLPRWKSSSFVYVDCPAKTPFC